MKFSFILFILFFLFLNATHVKGQNLTPPSPWSRAERPRPYDEFERLPKVLCFWESVTLPKPSHRGKVWVIGIPSWSYELTQEIASVCNDLLARRGILFVIILSSNIEELEQKFGGEGYFIILVNLWVSHIYAPSRFTEFNDFLRCEVEVNISSGGKRGFLGGNLLVRGELIDSNNKPRIGHSVQSVRKKTRLLLIKETLVEIQRRF